MDIISIVLTIFGLVISGAAYWKADNTKKVTQNTLKKCNANDDLKRLRSLAVTMKAANEAVSPWVAGMPDDRRTGRSQQDDLMKLFDITNLLRTKPPLDLDDAVLKRIK